MPSSMNWPTRRMPCRGPASQKAWPISEQRAFANHHAIGRDECVRPHQRHEALTEADERRTKIAAFEPTLIPLARDLVTAPLHDHAEQIFLRKKKM